MKTIIEVKDLCKSFAEIKAVNNLNFEVKVGELFAFLGQNGAGKSTTINILIGTLLKDSGTIVYADNEKFEQFKDKIGVVFQNNILDDSLTVEENLKLYGKLYSNKNVNARYEELAELLDFKSFEKKRFRTLSGGQKRRIEIARALFNTPKILFLDEPTTGLDPKTRIDVWNVINKVRQDTGMTVFLTTHYMEETADADRVVIIHNGCKIAEGTPAELKEKYSTDRLKIVPKDEKTFEATLGKLGIIDVKTADHYEIKVKDTEKEISLINQLKKEIKFFELIKGSMDDVFLNAVGENIEGGNN